MKRNLTSLLPILICTAVTACVAFVEWLGDREWTTPFQRVEWITYDWRVRLAADQDSIVATNLGLVAISDDSIETLLDGSLPYQFGLQWPRQVYGRLINELSTQGAKAVGFDVVFGELRPDHPGVVIDGELIPSDVYFAREMARWNNVVLATEKSLLPPDLFRTNAWSLAEVSAKRDMDGILRRAHAYSVANVWHPVIQRASSLFGWDLGKARLENGRVLFPREDTDTFDELPLNSAQEFDSSRLNAALNERRSNASPQWEKPFVKARLWQLGILLAARDLNLDLQRAHIDLRKGRIEIPVNGGGSRSIPVDREGRFYIDWTLTPRDSRLTKKDIEYLLLQHELRREGRGAEITNGWVNKLVVVGSTATGGNLTDIGATPLEHETYLMSSHWNVANSMLTNRFISPLSLEFKLLLIAAFGATAGVLTIRLRPLHAIFTVGVVAVGYSAIAAWTFVEWRLWLPIVLPVGGSLITTHVCLVTYLVRHEQLERRRTKDLFSKIVSPDVVGELLSQKKLSLVGSRRELTVFFADVRGFTEITDAHQQRAEREVAELKLNEDEAKTLFDADAAEVLRTVNQYFSIAADCIKKHEGTLDKYIGDCVMAFWGAPIPNPKHALCCVRAVIDMQRAIFDLNQQRRQENERRQEQNTARALNGEPPLPLLDILSLGSGINTGTVTVGLMGSDAHLVNYTVFGREVNLASRLEGASGRGRILIGEQTFRQIQRSDPELAAKCVEQPALSLKGFRDSIRAYEVPWRPDDVSMAEAGQSMTIVRAKGQRSECY